MPKGQNILSGVKPNWPLACPPLAEITFVLMPRLKSAQNQSIWIFKIIFK